MSSAIALIALSFAGAVMAWFLARYLSEQRIKSARARWADGSFERSTRPLSPLVPALLAGLCVPQIAFVLSQELSFRACFYSALIALIAASPFLVIGREFAGWDENSLAVNGSSEMRWDELAEAGESEILAKLWFVDGNGRFRTVSSQRAFPVFAEQLQKRLNERWLGSMKSRLHPGKP